MMESTMSEKLIDTLSPIESLPTEILLMILGYLPARERIRVERVCKRWREISTTGSVWKNVKILNFSERNLYIPCCNFARKWFVSYSEEDDAISTQIAFLSNRIQISSYRYYQQTIESITVRSEELFINFDELRIFRSLLSRIGRNVKKLIFDLILSDETFGPLLSIITEYCHKIEDIQLGTWHGGWYIRVSDFDEFSGLLQVNDQLESIMCCEGADIVEILPLKNWRSLHFEGDHSITEEWKNKMIALIQNSPSLEDLTLPIFTTKILAAISECKQLTNLALLERFSEPFQNDRMIEVPLMNNLKVLKYDSQSEGWENNFIPLINSSPSLQTLKIHALTRNILAAISRCKQLESLEFAEWRKKPVINDLVIEISSLNNLKRLEWTLVDFREAHREFIDLLHHHCKNLEGLYLYDLFDSDGPCLFPLEVERAILSLSKLNSLELINFPITDENLSHFGKFKSLRFSGFHCTEDGIFEMIMNSECLEKLHCSEKITLKLLKRLVKNTRERHKILKIVVDQISKEKLKICKNSKIHLIPEKFLD